MRDILDAISVWYDAGRPFVLATVVRTWKSSPRQPGASMAVGDDGEAIGSVSGGCVEGAVHTLAQEVMADGHPRLQTYGVSDDDAFAVGLTCGGTLQVFLERIDADTFPDLADVRDGVAGRRALAVATVIEGDGLTGRHLVVGTGWGTGSGTAAGGLGDLGHPGLDYGVAGQAQGLLEHGRTAVLRIGPQGQQREDGLAVFVESFAPPPTMFVFGAIDFSAAVVRTAKLLGYRVVVCDARPVFATTRRFPEADEVVVAWPHRYLQDADVDERSVICVLTHDPKFDVPLLELALRSKAAYVGAMGSRATHLDRLERLRECGVDEEALARLSSPIGLDIGARTPEETAISIAAEIIAATWGGTGRRLREVDAPIHR